MRKNLFLVMLLCCLFLVGCSQNTTTKKSNKSSVNENYLEEDILTEDILEEEVLSEKILEQNSEYKKCNLIVVVDNGFRYTFNGVRIIKEIEKDDTVVKTIETDNAELRYSEYFNTVYVVDNNATYCYCFSVNAKVYAV